GVRLVRRGRQDLGIDPRDDLALLDHGVEIDEELLDLTRDLATDLDGDDGVEVARGGHGGGEGPALDLGQAVLRGAIPALRVQVTPDPRAAQHDDNDNGDEAYTRMGDGRETPDAWRLR